MKLLSYMMSGFINWYWHLIFDRPISLAGQRSPRMPKVPNSIPTYAVSMQLGFMLKMEGLCALPCP